MADLERTREKNAKAGQRTDGDAARRKLDALRIGEVRDRLIPYAEAKGYLTDEDFFRDIS
jgi:hypothetical protein